MSVNQIALREPMLDIAGAEPTLVADRCIRRAGCRLLIVRGPAARRE